MVVGTNTSYMSSLWYYLPFHAWSIGESCDETDDDDDDDDDVCGRSSLSFCASVSAFWAR